MANYTWELTNLLKNCKSVGYKWVVHIKRDVLGEIVRHKAWLVAKGYFDVAWVNFNETFALEAKFMTIKCILAIEVATD